MTGGVLHRSVKRPLVKFSLRAGLLHIRAARSRGLGFPPTRLRETKSVAASQLFTLERWGEPTVSEVQMNRLKFEILGELPITLRGIYGMYLKLI